MKRYTYKRKYIYLDDNNKIVIITRHKKIGENYAIWKRNLWKQSRASTKEGQEKSPNEHEIKNGNATEEEKVNG